MSNTITTHNPLRNRVGLQGVDTSATVWLNDLPGLSTELVADLAVRSEWGNTPTPVNKASAVWEGVHRHALTRLLDNLGNCLNDFDFPAITTRTTPPARLNPRQVFSNQAGYVGLLLTLPPQSGKRLYLDTLQPFFGASTPFETDMHLQVLDLSDGHVLLHESTQRVGPGLFTIPLGLSVPTNPMDDTRILVLIDTTDVYLNLLETISAPGNDELTFSFATATATYPANGSALFTGPNSPFYLECRLGLDVTALLSRYATDLTTPYQYLCGSLLMTEKRATPNLSVFTLSNSNFTKEQESNLFADFLSTLKPVAKRIAADLCRTTPEVLPPAPVLPKQATIRSGSYV